MVLAHLYTLFPGNRHKICEELDLKRVAEKALPLASLVQWIDKYTIKCVCVCVVFMIVLPTDKGKREIEGKICIKQ